MGAIQSALVTRRTTSAVSSEENRPEPKTPPATIQLQLTKRQQQLLNQSWTGDFDQLYTIGSLIFEKLFTQLPQTKAVFAHAKNKPVEKLTVDDFDNFFLRFIRLISLCISNLRQIPTVLDPMLLHVGAMHVRLIEKGFQEEFWAVFPAATQAAVATVMRSEPKRVNESDWEDTCVAWRTLTEYMVAKMIIGFKAEKTRNI